MILGGKEFFAAVNATLNGSSAVLLVGAYIAIRLKRIWTHASLMIAALVLSSVFLCTYVYSKVAFGERSSGLAPGPLRSFYLMLLASHVLLAVGMLPPIVMTVWRAYTRQWSGHARLARPTIWIWFYVSGTGVIVYWMLYHLFPSMLRGG